MEDTVLDPGQAEGANVLDTPCAVNIFPNFSDGRLFVLGPFGVGVQ